VALVRTDVSEEHNAYNNRVTRTGVLGTMLAVTILHRLRVFENRVLRRIFGPKRDGVTGG
jgi:hypothetical protein